jgi:hypothetical protein
MPLIPLLHYLDLLAFSCNIRPKYSVKNDYQRLLETRQILSIFKNEDHWSAFKEKYPDVDGTYNLHAKRYEQIEYLLNVSKPELYYLY